jgi:hypothetical protein
MDAIFNRSQSNKIFQDVFDPLPDVSLGLPVLHQRDSWIECDKLVLMHSHKKFMSVSANNVHRLSVWTPASAKTAESEYKSIGQQNLFRWA